MDFDAHAHLPEGDRLRVPETWCGVVCATQEAEFEPLSELAKMRPTLIPAFGIHPWYVRERTARWKDVLRQFLEKTPRAQIGEIGLDKAKIELAPLNEQIPVFVEQLRLAAEKKCVAHIHCVRAWQEMTAILRREHVLPRLHFHAFSGSKEIVRQLMQLADATFSVSKERRERAGKKIRNALESIPENRLLEESDSNFSD